MGIFKKKKQSSADNPDILAVSPASDTAEIQPSPAAPDLMFTGEDFTPKTRLKGRKSRVCSIAI
jgi:hypothetical protein